MKPRLFPILITLLICLGFSVSSRAQYAAYYSQTFSSDQTIIYQYAQITGAASMNGYGYIFHMPIINNQLGSSQSNKAGLGVNPNSYIDYTSTITLPASALQYGQVSGQLNLEVYCSGLQGPYWEFGFGPPFTVELAMTLSDNVGGGPAAWKLSTSKSCSYNPPDFNPLYAFIQGYYPQYLGDAICLRGGLVGPNWACTPGIDIGTSGIIEPYPCTNYDRGIYGWPTWPPPPMP